MATLAQTACFRCRGQKLRCSREQPICARCKRLNAVCVFPEPPERKVRSHTPRKPSKSHPVLEHRASDDSNASAHSGVSSNAVDIPQDVQLLLSDVFFISFFNAHLMFHRPSFIQAVTEGGIPQHTLLAVYGLASNFLTSPLCRATFSASRLESVGDAKALGLRCVERSSELVLKHVIDPTMESSRTCLLLGLYWFSHGDSIRNQMFAGIANRGARAICQDSATSNLQRPWLQSELERRCLWATWMANLVNADHYINGTSADSFILNLPLPTSVDAFEQVLQEPVSTLSDTVELSGVFGPRPAPWNTNIRAELMRMILHWAKIQDHIAARKRVSAKQTIVDLLDLDHWLLNFARGLPAELQYTKRNLYDQMAVQRQPTFSLLHILICQCRLVLHASLVPQFGGLTSSKEISPETIRISAETAVKQANIAADMATDMIALGIDPSQLAPIVGYCMYVASTVHIVFMTASNQIFANTARTGLKSTLRVLKSMKLYWAHLQRLWARIHLLYEAQISRMPSPKQRDDIFNNDEHSSELDQIANSDRDVGRLTEPLSDSVLAYSLRRLKQKIEIDESSFPAQDLEKAMRYTAELRIAPSEHSDNHTSSGPNSAAYLSDGVSQIPNNFTTAALYGSNPYDPYVIDGNDWSMLDLESILLPLNQENMMQDISFDSMPLEHQQIQLDDQHITMEHQQALVEHQQG